MRVSVPPRRPPAASWRRLSGRHLRCRSVDGARSDLVLQETSLFLYQTHFDSRMQQAMLFDSFDLARKLREERDKMDGSLERFQTAKGPRSGAAPLSSEFMELTTSGLHLRNALSQAVEEERYDEAARLRDEIKKLYERAEEQQTTGGPSPTNVLFRLGQIVQHTTIDYRGVVCGWDLGCCESEHWKERAGIDALSDGADQPFYHVLVDERDWPAYTKGPPVGYVAQEMLKLVEELDVQDFRKIQHPWIMNLFLGTDNRGSYIPSMYVSIQTQLSEQRPAESEIYLLPRPLRNKYKIEREDSHPPEEDE